MDIGLEDKLYFSQKFLKSIIISKKKFASVLNFTEPNLTYLPNTRKRKISVKFNQMQVVILSKMISQYLLCNLRPFLSLFWLPGTPFYDGATARWL